MNNSHLYLDLSDETTAKYVDSGLYIDTFGYIYDTIFRPGDKLVVIHGGFTSPKLCKEAIVTVHKIVDNCGCYNWDNPHERKDLLPYKTSKSGLRYVREARLILNEVTNKVNPKHFRLLEGVQNMPALEFKNPTLVREVVESISTTGSTYTEVGEFLPFDSVAAARAYVTSKIREAVRARINYPAFGIYTQDSIAVAKEPEVTFK